MSPCYEREGGHTPHLISAGGQPTEAGSACTCQGIDLSKADLAGGSGRGTTRCGVWPPGRSISGGGSAASLGSPFSKIHLTTGEESQPGDRVSAAPIPAQRAGERPCAPPAAPP
jgi:hypothetical protein